jgi:hypothetical protein
VYFALKSITLDLGGKTSSISKSELKGHAEDFFIIISNIAGAVIEVPDIMPILP